MMNRTLFSELPCEHCGRAHRAEVRFKTRPEPNGLEHMEVGQEVAGQLGLERFQSFAGTVCCYCAGCFLEWRCDEAQAAFRLLADLVGEGRLAVRRKGHKESLAAWQLVRLGNERVNALRRKRRPAHEWDWLEGYKLSWDGRRLKAFDEDYFEFHRRFASALDKKLSLRGWVGGGLPYRSDFEVFVNADRRILIKNPKGKVVGR